MKKLVLATIATLSLASSAAFVQPALAKNGMGHHSGVPNVFVGCTISSKTPFLSYSFLQASGITVDTSSFTNTGDTPTNCADVVAAVEALGLHVVAEEAIGSTGILIHLDATNPGGNPGGNPNPGGHTGNNPGGNTGH